MRTQKTWVNVARNVRLFFTAYIDLGRKCKPWPFNTHTILCKHIVASTPESTPPQMNEQNIASSILIASLAADIDVLVPPTCPVTSICALITGFNLSSKHTVLQAHTFNPAWAVKINLSNYIPLLQFWSMKYTLPGNCVWQRSSNKVIQCLHILTHKLNCIYSCNVLMETIENTVCTMMLFSKPLN